MFKDQYFVAVQHFVCCVCICIWLPKGACENYINLTLVYFYVCLDGKLSN